MENVTTEPPTTTPGTELISTTAAPTTWGEVVVKLMIYQIAPLNITLCIFIIIQNILVNCHYYKLRRRFVPMMFMLIGTTDMLTAVGFLVQAIAALLFFNDMVDKAFIWRCWAIFFTLGVYPYTCSAFFNVVLVVVRTIYISQPFHRLNIEMVKVSLVFYSLIWFSVMLLDVYGIYLAPQTDAFLDSFWGKMEQMTFSSHIGFSIGVTFQLSRFYADVINYSLLTTAYLIPVAIVAICMIIQILTLSKSSRVGRAFMTNVRHLNITIVLISALFVIGNGTMTTFMFIYGFGRQDIIAGFIINNAVWYPLQGFFNFTLVLLNSALSPTIIISRNAFLRSQYTAMIRKAGVGILNGVRHLLCLMRCQGSHHYQVLDEADVTGDVPVTGDWT